MTPFEIASVVFAFSFFVVWLVFYVREELEDRRTAKQDEWDHHCNSAVRVGMSRRPR